MWSNAFLMSLDDVIEPMGMTISGIEIILINDDQLKEFSHQSKLLYRDFSVSLAECMVLMFSLLKHSTVTRTLFVEFSLKSTVHIFDTKQAPLGGGVFAMRWFHTKVTPISSQTGRWVIKGLLYGWKGCPLVGNWSERNQEKATLDAENCTVKSTPAFHQRSLHNIIIFGSTFPHASRCSCLKKYTHTHETTPPRLLAAGWYCFKFYSALNNGVHPHCWQEN